MFAEYGEYVGDKNIVSELKQDTLEVDIQLPDSSTKRQTVSRMVWVQADKTLFPPAPSEFRDHQQHAAPQIKTKSGSTTCPHEQFLETPLVAVRYYTNCQAVVNHFAYQSVYGVHRTNIQIDTNLDSGVYAFPCIGGISPLDLRFAENKHKIIGVLRGFLRKSDHNNNRISLDPRSCQFLGFFVPLDQDAKLPWTMPEEDKIAMRIHPGELGAPVSWFRQLMYWDITHCTNFAKLNNSCSEWND